VSAEGGRFFEASGAKNFALLGLRRGSGTNQKSKKHSFSKK
jgi:hypothetical protein